MKNTFVNRKDLPTCLAPWHALTVKWGGNVIPDIIYKGKLGNIGKQSLREILEGDAYTELRESHRKREIPESCQGCVKKEKVGRSRRLYFWDRIDHETKVASKDLTVDSVPDIRYLDFTLSNKCNLACIHCDPFVSTGWTKDGKSLNREKPEYWSKQPIGYHGASLDFMDNLFKNPEYFRNLQWVALRGGEPLYDEICLSVLQWFVDNGIASSVSLDISTNATVFKEEFRELFSHFKHVELLISVEATDELYSIIRGGPGYTWDQLNENIEKFYDIPNVEVVFAVTVMITNIFNLDKVWEWFATHHAHRASISMSNVVVHPGYLNIGNMPEELKALAYDKIKHIPNLERWPTNSANSDEGEYQTGIESIRNGLMLSNEDEQESDKQWNWFLKYTDDLDRLRKTDTLQYIPEIESYVR